MNSSAAGPNAALARSVRCPPIQGSADFSTSERAGARLVEQRVRFSNSAQSVAGRALRYAGGPAPARRPTPTPTTEE
jgi:hypothetical protein